MLKAYNAHKEIGFSLIVPILKNVTGNILLK